MTSEEIGPFVEEVKSDEQVRQVAQVGQVGQVVKHDSDAQVGFFKINQ